MNPQDVKRFEKIARQIKELVEKRDLVSPTYAADEFGINVTTLTHAVRRGDVPGGIKIGEKAWLVPREAIKLAIKNGDISTGRGQYERRVTRGRCPDCGQTVKGNRRGLAQQHAEDGTGIVCKGTGKPLLKLEVMEK